MSWRELQLVILFRANTVNFLTPNVFHVRSNHNNIIRNFGLITKKFRSGKICGRTKLNNTTKNGCSHCFRLAARAQHVMCELGIRLCSKQKLDI